MGPTPSWNAKVLPSHKIARVLVEVEITEYLQSSRRSKRMGVVQRRKGLCSLRRFLEVSGSQCRREGEAALKNAWKGTWNP